MFLYQPRIDKRRHLLPLAFPVHLAEHKVGRVGLDLELKPKPQQISFGEIN